MISKSYSEDEMIAQIVQAVLEEERLKKEAELRNGYIQIFYGFIPIIIFVLVAYQLPKITDSDYMVLGLFSLILIGTLSIFVWIRKAK